MATDSPMIEMSWRSRND